IDFFSLALSKARLDSVLPFEPVPLTVQRLRRNLARNPTVSERIIALNFGLGDFRGPVQFEESRQSPGQNRIAIATSPTRRDTSFCKIESLDEALTNLGIREIGFLKLDVEGFEPTVVQGGKNSLSTGLVRFVYSETIPKALQEAGYTVGQFEKLLRATGFYPVILNTPSYDNF